MEGWSVELLKDVYDIFNKCINLIWLIIWFVLCFIGKGLFMDVYLVMVNWGVNYGVLIIGYVGVDFIIFVFMLCILVCMYNVEEIKVYCFFVWAVYGMDIEG